MLKQSSGKTCIQRLNILVPFVTSQRKEFLGYVIYPLYEKRTNISDELISKARNTNQKTIYVIYFQTLFSNFSFGRKRNAFPHCSSKLIV